MAFHVVVTGSLRVPHALVEEWLAAPLMVDHHEWLADAETVPTTLATAEQLLAHLEELSIAPHEILDVHLEGDCVHVAAYLSHEMADACWAAMSRLFVSAAPFDAQGSLTILGYQGIQRGERISVSGGHASHRVLTVSERESAQHSLLATQLEERIRERFDILVGRSVRSTSAPSEANPFTGRF